MIKPKKLLIVDGYGLIFRAYYAVRDLFVDNIPIGAVLGFHNILLSILKNQKPDYLLIALDTGKRTFRDDLFDDFIESSFLEKFIIDNGDRFNLSFEDIKTLTPDALIDILQLQRDKINNFCTQNSIQLNKQLILQISLYGLESIEIVQYESQYKANRKKTPEELCQQFAIIKEFLDATNIKHLSVENHEADDLIASTVNYFYKNTDVDMYIASSDKDLYQLVNERIKIYNIKDKKIIDSVSVFDKFGVYPENITDYLALVGDASDNVPGVNGIGPKNATNLIQQFGSVENIINSIYKIESDKIRQVLRNNIKVLEFSKKLVILKNDLIKNDNLEEYKLNINYTNLNQFRAKYRFHSMYDSKSTNFL